MRGSADVHNNLGIALMGQGKTTEAIAEFRAAVELDPESPTAHRNLADALSSAKQYDLAIEEFRRAARLDPTGAAHFDLGSLLLELDRTEEAIAAPR
jgi:Flp pilus assembly protein TadD